MAINPLANPKGLKLTCELCNQPAFIQCTKCKVTYYCGKDHQNEDWEGVHEKICDFLGPIRAPLPFLSSKEERFNRCKDLKIKKKELLAMSLTTGQTFLFQEKHSLAIPAAMQSLKLAIDLHGTESVNLVSPYLILGEANIGLGNLFQAEEYLSQASWTILKSEKCPLFLKSKLHRIKGLLHAAKGEYTEALKQFAEDIFHASLEYGTDDISISSGYFHMANIHEIRGKPEIAESLHAEVIEIWYNYLGKAVKNRILLESEKKEVLHSEERKSFAPPFDEAVEAEAMLILNAVYERMKLMNGKNDESLCYASFTLAMLYFLLNKNKQALEYGRQASDIFSSADEFQNDELLNDLKEFIQACDVV